MGSITSDFLVQTIVQIVVTLLVVSVFGALVIRWSWRARWVRPLVRKVNPAKARELDEAEADDRARRATDLAAAADEKWRAMGEVLTDPAYVAWQLNVVRREHRDFLDRLTTLGVTCVPDVCGREYPVVCFHAESPDVPLKGFTKELLGSSERSALVADLAPESELDGSGTIPAWIASGGREGVIRSDYYRLLHQARKIKRWNMRGFELSDMTINSSGQVSGGRTAQITYGQNCLTSHVLGYELYRAYSDDSGTPDALRGLRPVMELEPNDDGFVVRPTPASDRQAPFHPMISVQALVVFKDVQGEWRTWVMQRSDAVAAMPGFWQFPPAGGFEIFGHEDADPGAVERQFSLEDALIREFLEEIFHDTDMTSDDQLSQGTSHRESPGFSAFRELRSKTPGISLDFLGVVLDLVALRSEYSFVIVDEGRHLANVRYETSNKEPAYWGAGSTETKKLEDISLEQVVPLLSDPRNQWNPSSAGLFALFAELATDEGSWLRQRWPDMVVDLPSPEG